MMDHEISVQNAPPEHMFCSPFPSPKLNLHSANRLQENVTPVSRLCASLNVTSLGTPVETVQPAVDIVDTPQKSSLQTLSTHLETPSITCVNRDVHSPLETPKCTPVQSITEIPISTFREKYETPFNTSVETPLYTALGKQIGTGYVKSTPRRNPRRSCLNKSHNIEQEEKVTKAVHRVSVFKGDLLKDPGVSQSVCVNNKRDKLVCSENDTALLDSLNQTINIPKGETVNVRKSLFLGAGDVQQSPVDSPQHNPLDWLPATFETVGARTEPFDRKKNNVEGSSARRLSFSCKKSTSKQKCVVPEYDPDNDIFAQGLMPNQFNVDVNSLKNEIGKLLNPLDPPTRLTKSSSCSALNDEEISQTRHGTPVSPRRKQSKHSPSPSKTRIKRTTSAPDILNNVGFETTVTTASTTATVPSKLSAALSDVKVTSEGKMRAYLRARDIIKNIRKRAQNVSNEHSQSVKPSTVTERIETNFQVNAQNNECGKSENNLLQEAAVNDLDDTDLPPTQPFESFILGDVTAYVEVISNNEDLSAGVRTELVKLGATVVPSFNKNVPVTHVIFNNGRLSTYQKAKKRNIPLVSVLWVEECRKAGVKVHESLFPSYQIERYESPSIKKELRRRRILNFYSDEKPRPSPRRKKGASSNTAVEAVIETPSPSCTVRKSAPVPKWVDEIAGENGMVRILVKMTGIGKKEFKELVDRPPTPDSDIEGDQNSPLPVRLLRKLAKNLPVNKLNCDDSSRDNVQNNEDAPLNVETSIENSFVKKLNEVSLKEVIEAPGIENTKKNESVSIQPENTCVSQVNTSDSQNNTLRKRTTKRKLLSPMAETLSISHDKDEVQCTVVENPHSRTPKRLSGDCSEKKMKLDISQKEASKESANPESCGNEGVARETCNQTSADPIRRSRRSSAYFVKTKKSSPSPVPQKPAIVCTLLHTTDVDVIASIVEKLGTYVLEKYVTDRSTHIVTGAPKRTMKVLKGMARGCWIISQEWVLKSLEARRWLDEEEFELTAFSPAVQKFRLEKLSFGGVFQPDIFRSCGPIFVSSRATAPRGDLVELILLCGGQIASKITRAQISVGRKHSGIVCVTALWILDSVQFYCCKPFDSYLFS